MHYILDLDLGSLFCSRHRVCCRDPATASIYESPEIGSSIFPADTLLLLETLLKLITVHSTGAVGFATSTLNSISTATGNAVSQLSGLATGLANANVSGTIAEISSTISGDIGALITTGSKYGTELASGWADSATSTVSSIGSNLGSLASGASDSAQQAFNTAQASLTTSIDSLAKSSQFSINFSDFNLSSMVAGVQPAAGYTNTVDRSVVDAAVNRVIGSPLIAPPTFGLPSFNSLGITADIDAAKKALAQAQSAAQGAVASTMKIG